jgi:predicted transcriptional regulator
MAIGAAVLAGGALALGDAARATFDNIGRQLAFAPNEKRPADALQTQPTVAVAEHPHIIPWWGAALLLGCGAIGLVFVGLRKPRVTAPAATAEVEETPIVPERLEAQFIAKRQQILQVLDRELWCVFDGRISIKDVLTDCPTTVRPDAPLARVRATMQEERIHHLLVIDMQGQLQGVISDRDLRDSDGAVASDVMTRNPATVTPATPVANAISLMLDRSISSLPVIDENRVVGIVTTSDMLMTLQCCVQLLQRLASTMWQPGVALGESWSEDNLAAATSTSGDGTGRLFDVVQAMNASQQ